MFRFNTRREDIQIIVVDDNSDNIIVDDFPGINKKNIEIYLLGKIKALDMQEMLDYLKLKASGYYLQMQMTFSI